MHADETFMDYVVFRDGSTFDLSGHVDTHNARIWSLENPHEVLELQQDSPKLNVFSAISRRKVYGSFVFGEPTITGSANLDDMQLWFFLNRKKVKHITSFGMKMVHRLTVISQYAIV
ncbi:uncharacterized protein TNCV_4514051 [Trichonephila clavipes]|nr:uncharacterized protein TNCV_4514051 [Trichonephila clavipes]